MKSNKTKKVTNEELEILREEANRYTIGISEKRIRKVAKHRDQAYNDASVAQKLDAGVRGGLVAGSGYHYDRGYNGHSYSFYDEE